MKLEDEYLILGSYERLTATEMFEQALAANLQINMEPIVDNLIQFYLMFPL
jgi:hypothetical protein